MMSNNLRFGFALLFVITAGIVYWYGANTEKPQAPGFKSISKRQFHSDQLLSHWRQQPKINGWSDEEVWERPSVVAFVFRMSDCGLCLARMDELVAFVDSLSEKQDIGLLCVGISPQEALLVSYLAASPKPCMVLQDTTSVMSDEMYDSTPQIIIIDKREETLAVGSISSSVITREFRDNLRSRLLKGRKHNQW